MQKLTVQHATDTENVLRQITEIVLTTFDNRIFSVYLGGSLSRGEMTAHSDIDITVVFHDTVTDDEYARFMRLRAALQGLSPFRLDMWPVSEAKLRDRPANQNVRQSVCLYGDPFLAHVPAQSMDTFAMRSVHKAIHYMCVLRNRPKVNRFPLTYPDPDDYTFGYTQHADFDGESFKPGTRILVDLVTRCTTAILAKDHGIEVLTKRESVDTYRAKVGRKWGDYVQHMYAFIRDDLSYKLPITSEHKSLLRELCTDLLHFENDMLTAFKPIILNRLTSEDRRQRKLALVALKNVQFADEQTWQALRDYPHDDLPALLSSVREKYDQSPKD